MDSQQ